MKKYIVMLFIVSAIFLVSACSNKEAKTENDKVKIVSSFTILSDMAREIGGDDVEVHNLVPTGQDPHEFEPKPEDIKRATDADLLLYNGLNLEGGKNGWFFKMMDVTKQDEQKAINTTDYVKKVEPRSLSSHDGKEEETNPHAFISPKVGVIMAENIKAALVKVDAKKASIFEKRADAYIKRLQEMDKQYEKRIVSIPEKNRTLVTSERAFQYMTEDYGLKEGFIWAIDTEENGSPKQIKSLIEFLHDHKVPVAFVETNVDARPMETVSKESGMPIYKKKIYSDEIGSPGAEIDTYMKYLQYNIDLIADGLGGK